MINELNKIIDKQVSKKNINKEYKKLITKKTKDVPKTTFSKLSS